MPATPAKLLPPGDTIDADLFVRHPGFVLDVALRLPGQGVSVLLGPSGCGKTTVLRALAGLGPVSERARGRVVVRGEVWQDDACGLWRPVHQRPIGMVFQEASLFEHLTVQGNLDYGWRRVPPSQRRLHHDDVIGLLGIGHLLQRRPPGLSGGERQRAAIARALVNEPKLLLCDEPTGSLDTQTGSEVLDILQSFVARGSTLIVVTHDSGVAARAPRRLEMTDGRLSRDTRDADARSDAG